MVIGNHLVWVLWVTASINLGVMGFLGHLVWFHLKLKRLGISTYDYIKLQENRQRVSKVVTRIIRETPDMDKHVEMKKVEPFERTVTFEAKFLKFTKMFR